ncbi:MAG: hypothetical protein CL943_01570 [Candidatus Diapherotrites archaeon]|uniref:DUF106 domain-containing protein n=1 Tax=Candidatus Iainarchaeum sp. TaxID=3101447 RepID=A0A2D6M0P6_9ARCH|nr:hypothetical protein [Candidatus Diapherotrites archaeon]|tara:strand:+ start:9591 stop:10061 length:471 start_codon:yes stop_codon:yes gene_type:complete
MVFGNVMLEIALVSLVMSGISQILQRKLMDKKGMKASQEKMKEQQKRIKELVGREDQQSKAEAERLQKEMLELMSKSMQGTMKHMVVSMPIFLGVFWGLGYLYSGALIQLPMAVPVLHRDLSFEITSAISWLWWYIYTSFSIGIVLNMVLKVLGKE